MAGMLQKSWVVMFSLCCCFMKECKSAAVEGASPSIAYNVMHLSKERLKSSEQELGKHRFGAGETGEQDAHTTKGNIITAAHAKICHRNLLSQYSNETRQEILLKAIKGDEARVRAIQNQINHGAGKAPKHPNFEFQSPMSSGLSLGTGEYLALVGVGTPRRDMYLVVDTGSDIMWLQCAPCNKCYKQKDPVFDPTKSSSYKALGCDAAFCLNLNVMGCVSRKCRYQTQYGDGSFTTGDFATENVVLDAATGSSGDVVISNTPLGCGHDNEGVFGMAAGILGLGLGPLSFANHVQAGGSGGGGGGFSYCLPDRESDRRSSLIFGDDAILDHPTGALRFTPQLRNPRVATYYYVQITGISVGGIELTSIPYAAFHLDVRDGTGGTILDSGTTVSRLPTPAYNAVRDAFRSATHNLTAAKEFDLFDTCFDFSGLDSISVPTVTFHFQGGYDMRLPPENYLVPVDSNDRFCLALAPTTGPCIVGNVQQQGFRVVYDNVRMQIGFLPGQC